MNESDKEQFKTEIKESIREFDAARRDDMESLKNEIIVAIRKDAFKGEILEELKASGWKASFWKKAQHPAVLLIIGFALTTGLGSWLTYIWQNKANEKQVARIKQQQSFEQEQNTRQRTIQQKYDLIDQVVKAVADTNTAAEDILIAFTWSKKDRRTYLERAKYWQEASRKWRVDSKILFQKLTFRFKDKQIGQSFQDIIDKRKDVGVTIEYIQGLLGEKGWERMQNDAETSKERKRCNHVINEIKDDVGKLMQVMMAEIQSDEKPTYSTPP